MQVSVCSIKQDMSTESSYIEAKPAQKEERMHSRY